MSPEDALPTPLRVVIVDDTPDLRDLLATALTRRGGYEVAGRAGNGREGVEVVRLTQPDMVLLDVAMPVMDGLEALPLVREACPRATVVMLSGFGAGEMAEKAIALGADGYIQKGIPLRQLLSEVAEHQSRATPARRRQPVVD